MSDIFNFESLRSLKPARPSALLWAVLLVIGMEVVRALPLNFLFVYNSRLGLAQYMHDEILPQFPAPQIVFLGTSRGADAVTPSLLDEKLKLPPRSTVNLSMIASHSSDWLSLYEANREKLKQAKVVFCLVDEWIFSSGFVNDEHYCMTAPLLERWTYAQQTEVPPPPAHERPAEQRARDDAYRAHLRNRRDCLLMDWVFASRLKLPAIPAAIFRVMNLGKMRRPKTTGEFMVRSNVGERMRNQVDDLNHYHDRIALTFKNFDTHPAYVRRIERLGELCAEDHVRFVLVSLPNRSRYQDEVERLEPGAFDLYKRTFTKVADDLHAARHFITDPKEIGLTDTDYEDYGHMLNSGSRGCTEWFAKIIERDDLLEEALNSIQFRLDDRQRFADRLHKTERLSAGEIGF